MKIIVIIKAASNNSGDVNVVDDDIVDDDSTILKIQQISHPHTSLSGGTSSNWTALIICKNETAESPVKPYIFGLYSQHVFNTL